MLDTRDVLLKAASDVEQGMWCRMAWFTPENHSVKWGVESVIDGRVTVEAAQKMQRCAEGSIALVVAQMGGTTLDYDEAVHAAAFDSCPMEPARHGVFYHNDYCMPRTISPFEAGAQWAQHFREAADRV